MAKKKNLKDKLLVAEQYSFIAVLAIFVIFSVYTIFSYYFATTQHLDFMKASVLDGSGVMLDGKEVKLSEGKVVDGGEPVVSLVFKDLGPDHKHFEAVSAFYEAGLLKGYEDGTFKPDLSVSRADFWAIVNNAMSADFSGLALENCFEDVKTEWFAVHVCFAKDMGYVTGFEGNVYRPNQPVSKAEAIKMLSAAFDLEVPKEVRPDLFEDVSAEDWFAPYAQLAVDEELFNQSARFMPNYNMTRGDLVTVVYKLLKAEGRF